MRVAVFDVHRFERPFFESLNREFGFELVFFEAHLTELTVPAARGFDAVCAFVNDKLDAEELRLLKAAGVRLVALRSAGFNHVDLHEAAKLGLKVVRVPSYSPYAVAEHAVALLLSLDRKIHRSYQRVREQNFSLDGLVGYDLHGKTVGIVGTGKIGRVMATIMKGFGCRVLAYDVQPDRAWASGAGVEYTGLEDLFKASDIVSLHVPLLSETKHIINESTLAKMKPGVTLINTGRGALIDTLALIEGLKSGHVGAAGLDVYEEEENVFFQDLSDQVLQDDVLARLLTFPNVLVTAHQGFLTREALENIARTTLENIKEFDMGQPLTNEIKLP